MQLLENTVGLRAVFLNQESFYYSRFHLFYINSSSMRGPCIILPKTYWNCQITRQYYLYLIPSCKIFKTRIITLCCASIIVRAIHILSIITCSLKEKRKYKYATVWGKEFAYTQVVHFLYYVKKMLNRSSVCTVVYMQ